MEDIENNILIKQESIKTNSQFLFIQHCFDNDDYQDQKDILERNLMQKNEQIRKTCSENYQEMIENFQRLYKLRSAVKSFFNETNEFEQKLEKIRKSNTYDKREINMKLTQIQNIDKLKRSIVLAKEGILLAQKAVKSSMSDQLTTSIRNIEKMKNHCQNNHLNSIKLQSVIQQVIPLIQTKIQSEADNKIIRWQTFAKQKQLEIGQQVLQQCEIIAKNNMNNRLSTSMGDRQSIFFDNSSQQQKGKVSMMISKQRVSVVNPQGRISNMGRVSVLPSRIQNLNDAPSSRVVTSMKRMSFTNRMSQNLKNNDIIANNFSIELSSLKQPQFIYEMMKLKQNFISQLKMLRHRLLYQTCEADQVNNISDLQVYLANIVGFFVIDLDLQKTFPDYDQSKQLMIDSFKNLEKHIKSIYLKIPVDDLNLLKKELLQFGTAFAQLKVESISHSINKILSEQFSVFCLRKISPIKGIITNKIEQDGFSLVKTTIREDYEQYVKIFNLPVKQDQLDEAQFFLVSLKVTPFLLPFSQIVSDCIHQINWFIDECTVYLSGLPTYDDIVIQNLDLLYQKIFDVIKIFAQTQSQKKDALQLCQLLVNLNYLEISIKYYRKQIENYLQISSTKDFIALTLYREAKLLCEEAISDQLNDKIYEILQQLKKVEWEPQQPNNGPHDFVNFLVEYLEQIFQNINLMIPEFVQSVIYMTFKFINSQIWKILVENVKNYNILGLANLNQDIICLARLCNTKFSNHNQLMECLKEIREFVQIFLTDKPEDYLDLKKRNSIYSHLNGQKLLIVFPKYNKIKYPKYPIVRKRDLKAICKKIQDNPGQF